MMRKVVARMRNALVAQVCVRVRCTVWGLGVRDWGLGFWGLRVGTCGKDPPPRVERGCKDVGRACGAGPSQLCQL